jgi:hypothetical protein
VEAINQGYWGKVTAVTKNSITIERAAYTETRVGDGAILARPAQPPKLFMGSSALAAGKFTTEHGRSYSYRLSDVVVGDVVNIHFSRIDGMVICDSISIARRPGGRVPPAPGEVADEPRPHHERMNAHWDLEEKGIPLPEKFRPAWELREVAPAPREVAPVNPKANP